MNDLPIFVRPMMAEDVSTVAAFNISMALETESLRLAEEVILRGVGALLIDPSKGFYRLAEHQRRVVGQLMITAEWSDWRCGYWWWIQSVYVPPDSRRLGVFRALYESILHEARTRGDICGLRLYVEKDNQSAQATYESLGMKPGKYALYEAEIMRQVDVATSCLPK